MKPSNKNPSLNLIVASAFWAHFTFAQEGDQVREILEHLKGNLKPFRAPKQKQIRIQSRHLNEEEKIAHCNDNEVKPPNDRRS